MPQMNLQLSGEAFIEVPLLYQVLNDVFNHEPIVTPRTTTQILVSKYEI